jgi:ubiquinone/menaquinone biosynthesis C-methylase UbiE
MNERVYNNEIERLRSEERRERLQPGKVADLVTKNISSGSIIEIGTGSGLFAEEFSKRNFKVTGIDSNPEMIKAAGKYVPEAEFRIASAENLPFSDKSFDAAFMGLVLHETDDYLKALQEMKRVSLRDIFILEWKYAAEEFGPPLEHRLKREFIEELAVKAGFIRTEVTELQNLDLYRLEIG